MKASIDSLTPDPENARVHTARGQELLTETLAELGAGRSVVVDENGVVLAGNGTVEAAKRAGIMDIEIVDASPDTLVAVQRDDLSPQDKKRMALVDNRAAELSGWDPERLNAYRDEGILVGDFWSPEEFIAVTAAQNLTPKMQRPPSVDKAQPADLRYGMTVIPLTPEATEAMRARIQAHITKHGSTDGFGGQLVREAEEAMRAQSN